MPAPSWSLCSLHYPAPAELRARALPSLGAWKGEMVSWAKVGVREGVLRGPTSGILGIWRSRACNEAMLPRAQGLILALEVGPYGHKLIVDMKKWSGSPALLWTYYFRKGN